MANFIGRLNEIKQLRNVLDSSEASIALIYGRRRIGKSYLIAKACEGKHVFNFEGLEQGNTKDQIRNFLFQLEIQTAIEIKDKSKVSSWSEAISKLFPFLKESPGCVLVFDEFQWMASYRSALVSEFKMLYDQYLSKVPGLTVILCGSIASFMVKKVLKSKALYGRIELNIHLKEFNLFEVRQVLNKHSLQDCLLAYLVFGGVPKYLTIIKTAESIPPAIQRLCFDQSSILRMEFEKIFVSHFGKEGSYSEIVRTLLSKAIGLTKQELESLTSSSGGGQTTRELYNLEMAGFIEGFVPYNKKNSSKYKRYRLVDLFTSFYLNFVESNIESNQKIDFFNMIYTSPKFKSFLGLAFELACLKHSSQIARILGFSGVAYRVGAFWKNPSYKFKNKNTDEHFQFDLVFERADKIITVCEVKYSDQTIGLDVGKKLQEQIANVAEFQNRTVQRVLISKSQPSKDLVQSAFFNQVIRAEELFIE